MCVMHFLWMSGHTNAIHRLKCTKTQHSEGQWQNALNHVTHYAWPNMGHVFLTFFFQLQLNCEQFPLMSVEKALRWDEGQGCREGGWILPQWSHGACVIDPLPCFAHRLAPILPIDLISIANTRCGSLWSPTFRTIKPVKELLTYEQPQEK